MNERRRAGMGEASLVSTRVATNIPAVADEDLPADIDEPPDNRLPRRTPPVFCRSPIPAQMARQPSLLTKALLHSPEPEVYTPEFGAARAPIRRRSINSNGSIASTAELTSDGGLTSPSRTNTPSPPLPANAYSNIPPLYLAQKAATPTVDDGMTEPLIAGFHNALGISTKPDRPIEAPAPRKRCITFACGGRKDVAANPAQSQSPASCSSTTDAPKRACGIKFACPAKPAEKPLKSEGPTTAAISDKVQAPMPRSPLRKLRIPTSPARSRRATPSPVKPHSPCSLRSKPKYIVADEESLQSSEATQFHEFAREEVQDDDWIRRDSEEPKAKITINDTLKVENAIRKLGDEAEEEAQDEDEEEAHVEGDSADEGDELVDDNASDPSDEEFSDGNETDNEAGFADSDDESDPEGHYQFWTPEKFKSSSQPGVRPSAHRKVSTSSIDSTNQTRSIREGMNIWAKARRNPQINIRPDTPELPDSTDFVCGTLDEDRPLEEAYASCLEARKHAKRHMLPQDIDPSFPTSDPEDEDEDEEPKPVENAKDSDEHMWLGKFEDSDEGRLGRRRSPVESPKRMLSPAPKRYYSPPPKSRFRSPPPRKLFGHSPKRLRSPAPSRVIHSPAPSATESPDHLQPLGVGFAPLGSRPGLTHTKSLPRTPAVYCRQARVARLDALKQPVRDVDGHVRGAIDIVKGLEHKRQYRREKYDRSRRCQQKKKPQPGKGAERMRELGLVMAGKTGTRPSYMLSL